MDQKKIISQALNREELTLEEGLYLYRNLPDAELYFVASEIRKSLHPDGIVSWIIDRNVNSTNVCISGCKFCSFHRKFNHKESYTTTRQQYREKIQTMIESGGEQLLLQGGMHPKYGLPFYVDLFKQLKEDFPNLKLHALGPPEIAYIAKKERMSFRKVLEKLVAAGLDSLPGAGAEILCDRVRKHLSPGKCSSQDWLDVMREAHKMRLVTSATMMFGHIETLEERLKHLIKIRQVQDERPEDSGGFTAFIPWPYMGSGTVLEKEIGSVKTSTREYVRTIALSRIMLPNIKNIQASWLTVGKEAGQLCLHAGANDLGSIMLEENVVSSTGVRNVMDADEMQKAIIEAGFIPRLRNQGYEFV